MAKAQENMNSAAQVSFSYSFPQIGRLQRPKPSKTPKQSPVWHGEVTCIAQIHRTKLLRRHCRGVCVDGSAPWFSTAFSAWPGANIENSSQRFQRGITQLFCLQTSDCSGMILFHFALCGYGGTSLKIKVEILCNPELKCGLSEKHAHGKSRV